MKMHSKIKHMLLALLLAKASLGGNMLLASERKICNVQVLAPAAYQAATTRVTVQEASTNYTMQPPVMGYGEKKIKIAAGYVEYDIIPARFKEVIETVEVERERIEVVTEPPVYRTETRRVKVKDATLRWNPACSPVIATEGANVPGHCLIEIPAEYQEITRQVIETPARTYKKVIPAKIREVTRKILVSPAKVVRREIPPQYTTVKQARVEQAPRILSEQVAEQTSDLPVANKIRPERIVTRPALCEDSLVTADILRLQQHLQHLGYYQGSPDGALGPKTRTALTRYQEDNGLASGAITLETVQKLPL